MGTYTTNKNLFMPTVGEQGWGELVNGNFETIDNFLKPITVSGSTYTFTGNQTGGTINATSITNSGTLTNTGKITANGGIGTNALTTTSISNSGTLTQTGTSTFTGKITANGGVNNYEERITALETGEFETIATDTLSVNTFILPLPTSGTILLYKFDGFSMSGDWTTGGAWRDAGTFTIPSYTNALFRPENIETMTVSISAYTKSSNSLYGSNYRVYDSADNVVMSDSAKFGSTVILTGDLYYGETYRISYQPAGSYPKGTFSFTAGSFAYYLY